MLLTNSSGQDVDYRLSGGGAASTEWKPLRPGVELRIALSLLPCTLEVRVGKVVTKYELVKPHDGIEIHLEGRKCKFKVKKQARPKQGAA
jgi:hypothetical protein